MVIGYLLWLFGFTGAHRFYYGRQVTGVIWFFTLGLLGIGWLIDLFLIPGMDRKASLKFRSGRYDYSVAWILLTFLGVLGIHRFYLGKPVTGLLWLLSFGLLGIGWLLDFFTLNGQVDERNLATCGELAAGRSRRGPRSGVVWLSSNSNAHAMHLIFVPLSFALAATLVAEEARPAGAMKTRWAAGADAAAPLPEHPRPSLVRETAWQNLNGLWDYAIVAKDAAQPEKCGRQDPGAVLRRVAALAAWQRVVGPEKTAVVPAQFATPARRQARANGCCCTSARSTGRPPCGSTARSARRAPGRLRSVHFDITDGAGGRRARTGGRGLGSDRRRPAAARQAGAEAGRHLVHGGDRDLADGVAGAVPQTYIAGCAATSLRRPDEVRVASKVAKRRRRPTRRRSPSTSSGGQSRLLDGRRAAGARRSGIEACRAEAAGRPSSRSCMPVRRQRRDDDRGRQLFRACARSTLRQGQARHQPAVPQRRAAVPDTARSTRAGGPTGSTRAPTDEALRVRPRDDPRRWASTWPASTSRSSRPAGTTGATSSACWSGRTCRARSPAAAEGERTRPRNFRRELEAMIDALQQPPVDRRCGCRSTRAGASRRRPGHSTCSGPRQQDPSRLVTGAASGWTDQRLRRRERHAQLPRPRRCSR